VGIELGNRGVEEIDVAGWTRSHQPLDLVGIFWHASEAI
jgi:hypothetical protein